MIAPEKMIRTADNQDDTLNMLQIAKKLESEDPLWIVVFGVYSRQFVAFPRFNVPAGTIVVARYPGALMERMRQTEREMHMPRTLPPSTQNNWTQSRVFAY
jgi:hypothetical protein